MINIQKLFRQGIDLIRSRELSFYSNSLYLMIDSVSGALLGFLFWFIAARLFNTEAVGLSSALMSAAGLLAFIACLGQDAGLIRFLPGAPDKGKLVNVTLTLTGITALIVGMVFILGIPLWTPSLSIIRENPFYTAAFVLVILILVLFAILGAVCVSYKRADLQLIRSLIFNGGKLLLLFALTSIFGMLGIFFSWGIAAAMGAIFGFIFFLPRLIKGYRPALKLEKIGHKEMLGFSLTNYLSSGLWSLPGWILPLMMVTILGAASNAHFFIGLNVGNIAAAIPGAISMSIFAEGANKIESLRRNVNRGIKMIALLLIPSEIVLVLFGGVILSLFGKEYGADSIFTLRLVALSALPLSITQLYLAVSRVEKHLKRIIWINGGIAIGILGFSYLFLKVTGINGAAIAWLSAHTVIGLSVLPFLIKSLRAKEQR